MRVALIHSSQETNDFHSLLTTLADNAAFGIHEGPAVLEKARAHFDQRTSVVFETCPVTLFITERRGTAGKVPDTSTGPGQSDVKTLPWKRAPRRTFPLKDIATWRG